MKATRCFHSMNFSLARIFSVIYRLLVSHCEFYILLLFSFFSPIRWLTLSIREREDFVVVVVALLLCWLLVREMLCKILFNRPSITHQKNHVIFHNFFSSCVLSSLCLFFFLINMHNNAESEQFKCTQRLAHSVAVIDYSKWASNMHFVSKMKQNYWLNIAHTDIHSQTHRTHQRLWIAWEILNEWKWIRLKVNSISISEVFLSHSITMKLETI